MFAEADMPLVGGRLGALFDIEIDDIERPARPQRVTDGRHDRRRVVEIMIGVGDERRVDGGRRQGDRVLPAENRHNIIEAEFLRTLIDELQETRLDVDGEDGAALADDLRKEQRVKSRAGADIGDFGAGLKLERGGDSRAGAVKFAAADFEPLEPQIERLLLGLGARRSGGRILGALPAAGRRNQGGERNEARSIHTQPSPRPRHAGIGRFLTKLRRPATSLRRSSRGSFLPQVRFSSYPQALNLPRTPDRVRPSLSGRGSPRSGRQPQVHRYCSKTQVSNMAVTILLGALAVVAVVFITVWARKAFAEKSARALTFEGVGLGAVTNFFDTLGIGSFAPTTAWIKFRKLTADENIPATLNVGHALPTIAQAFIFINLVKVDVGLLIACIVAAVAGAIVGAPIVARMPVRAIRIGMGLALLIAASLFALANLGKLPAGGSALALEGPMLFAAIGAHFVLGALMTLGIGLYAPSLILLSLMGLDPRAAFPIMMGACAFLMPVGAMRFFPTGRVAMGLALAMAIGGIPAVLVAALIVKSLPLEILRWGVVVVVLYASALMLWSARQSTE